MVNYIPVATAQFIKYRKLAEKAIAQVPDSGLWWQYNSESNSIAIIMKHMAGNMLSRWTDIFEGDGEKPWRKRDEEFLNDGVSREELVRIWNSGWERLMQTLTDLREEDLDRIIYIREEPLTVLDAIVRQLTHYASHVGQVIYIAKMLTDDQWKTLSIPRKKI